MLFRKRKIIRDKRRNDIVNDVDGWSKSIAWIQFPHRMCRYRICIQLCSTNLVKPRMIRLANIIAAERSATVTNLRTSPSTCTHTRASVTMFGKRLQHVTINVIGKSESLLFSPPFTSFLVFHRRFNPAWHMLHKCLHDALIPAYRYKYIINKNICVHIRQINNYLRDVTVLWTKKKDTITSLCIFKQHTFMFTQLRYFLSY